MENYQFFRDGSVEGYALLSAAEIPEDDQPKEIVPGTSQTLEQLLGEAIPAQREVLECFDPTSRVEFAIHYPSQSMQGKAEPQPAYVSMYFCQPNTNPDDASYIASFLYVKPFRLLSGSSDSLRTRPIIDLMTGNIYQKAYRINTIDKQVIMTLVSKAVPVGEILTDYLAGNVEAYEPYRKELIKFLRQQGF
jgi:hypothetical protein